MASPSTTINANLNINPASVKSAQKTVQSAFSNINLNPKSVSQFSNSLGRITGQASEFKKSMDAATARVFAFGATATVINALSQSFKSLVASTIDVEKRLIEINSIFGATEKQFASFRKSIFEVAKNTGQSFAVVADGAAELARQGLSAEETAKRLNASLILTRVSGLDAVSSVNSLTAALNGFTSAGLTAESVVNKIIAVDTAFAVSAKDLAEGFQRAGSTAEDAGVSFDELLGLITSVQQKTARGGAVIGNAFKSIFTRLSRGTTISELQELGVQIDASQSGVQKLQALSSALQNVADPTVASKIKELAGGVFQINVVSAALKDLSSETSIFADAASKSAAASNEAFSKNEALNKSLAAQINALVVGATNLAEKIGQITLAPVISDLTSLATKFTDFLNNALDEDSGNALIKGFFKGIATFIQGPGIILVTGAFLNIFKIVAKFAKEGFQDLLKIGSGQEKIKSIEAGIVQLLSQDESLRKKITSTTITQAQKEQLVIQAIQRENALLREQQAILAQLATASARAGVTGFGAGRGFSGKKGRGFASGFMPIEGAMEVAEARSLGARGAVRPRLSQGTIGGRKFIMNSQETEIPNFGRNGDSAVIPNYAKGFVPNFTRRAKRSRQQQVDENTSVADFEKLSNTQLRALPFKNAKIALANKEAGKVQSDIGSINNRVNIDASPFGFLVPQVGFSGTLSKAGNFDTPRGKVYYNMTGVNAKGPILPANVEKVEDPEALNLERSVRKKILGETIKFARVLVDPESRPRAVDVSKRLNKQKGGKGAIQGAVGAAFEAGVATALSIDEVKINKTQGDFDLRATSKKGINPDIFKLFNIQRKFTLGDFKASASPDNLNSFAKKILKNKTRGSFEFTKNKYAKGFIPNFADPLAEAISRETSGTGISKSQVRISNDKRLANKSNPLGLAVTNTRDEPNGLRDVFAGGFVPNFKKEGGDGVAGAIITSTLLSFAQPAISKAIEEFNSAADKVKDLSGEVSDLETELEGVDEKINPEKFNQLSAELAGLNQQLEKAKEASANFSNTSDTVTTGLISTLFAIQAIAPSLKDADSTIGKFGRSLAQIANIEVGRLDRDTFRKGRKGRGKKGVGGAGGVARDLATFTVSDILGNLITDKIFRGKGEKGAPRVARGGGRFGKIAGLAQSGFSALKAGISRPARAPRSPLGGVSNANLLKIQSREALRMAKTGVNRSTGTAKINKIDDEFARRAAKASKSISAFGKKVRGALKPVGNFVKLGVKIGGLTLTPLFTGIEAFSASKQREQRFNDQMAEFDPRTFTSGLDVLVNEAEAAREKINIFDGFSGPDGSVLNGLGELVNIPKLLVGIQESFTLAAVNASLTDEELQNMNATIGVTPRVLEKLDQGLLQIGSRGAFTRISKDIQDAIDELPKILQDANLGPELSIAFKNELDLLKQNVASGGLGARNETRRGGLQALSSSPLLQFASAEQKREFAKENLKRQRRLDISDEALQSNAAFNRVKGSIEQTRSARLKSLNQIEGVNLGSVTAGSAKRAGARIDSSIEKINKNIADLEKIRTNELALPEGDRDAAVLESTQKRIAQAKNEIKTLQDQQTTLEQAGKINQEAQRQAFLSTALPSILREASTGDGQSAVDRFERFQEKFLEGGGSQEDLQEASKQLATNLQASVDRQREALQNHQTEVQQAIADDINSRLQANKVQQEFIKSIEQNFGKNLDDFERFSDPSSILSEIPQLGDRSAMFEFLQGLDISGAAARQGAIATTSGSLTRALAAGAGDQLEDLVFGTELGDKREALRQARADLAAGTGTQEKVDEAEAAVKAADAAAQQKARSEIFNQDQQAFFDDINERAQKTDVGALFGQFTQDGRRFDSSGLSRKLESRDEINTGADAIARIKELKEVLAQLSQLDIDPSDKAAQQAQKEAAVAAAAELEAIESAYKGIRGSSDVSQELMDKERQVREEGVAALQKAYDDEVAALNDFIARVNGLLSGTAGGGGGGVDASPQED